MGAAASAFDTPELLDFGFCSGQRNRELTKDKMN